MTQPDKAQPTLEINQLTKRFRHGGGVVEAVRGVSLTLRRGEFAAVMGASGSGKSTLLHLVGGLTRPDEGSVRIAGVDVHALDDHGLTLFRRKHIGLVFQAFNLIPTLTGEENILLPMLLGGQRPRPERVEALITRLGLQGVRHRRPDAMSGGEQQRIAIGRALISEPTLILADEPTGSLDTANGRRLCETFQQLCQEHGATVLMVTHNPVVAFSASRFIILQDGQLVTELARQECPTLQELNQRYLEILEREVAA